MILILTTGQELALMEFFKQSTLDLWVDTDRNEIVFFGPVGPDTYKIPNDVCLAPVSEKDDKWEVLTLEQYWKKYHNG
jgi:hypothetical protein